ncbi:MAG: hypothetical protein GF349_02995 [Candidatus Magasanikbacteria bacterium]|nr:hypothetical protein [Candidatus Magasanikbacteria bacterium]
MTFVWVSERISKNVDRNLVGETVASVSEDPRGIQDFEKMNIEATTVDYNVKEKEIFFKAGPNKNKKALINFVVIEFDGQPYLVTKIKKYEKK